MTGWIMDLISRPILAWRVQRRRRAIRAVHAHWENSQRERYGPDHKIGPHPYTNEVIERGLFGKNIDVRRRAR